ncbi:MAG: TolC family protein [Thermoanaerobaculia bacterium]
MRPSLHPLRLALVALLSLGALAFAAADAALADEAAPPLTLSAAVERALGRYPAVAAARSRLAEATEAAGEIAASRGPMLKVNAQALGYDDPMLTSPIHSFRPADIPPFSETIVQGSLNVAYTLIDSGANRERTRQAAAQEATAGAALSTTEQAIAARVATAYAGALARAEILAAQQARVAALGLELDRARQLFAAGKAAEVDTLRADAALAAAEAEQTRAAGALDGSERDLARLLQAEPEETRAGRLAPWASPAPLLDSRAALQERAVAAGPAVEQARQQIAVAEAARALARSAYFPKLDLVGAVQEFREGGSDYTTDWNAGVQVVVPIWDGGQTGRRVARASAQRDTATAMLEQSELDAREAVDRAWNTLADSAARAEALARAADRLGEVARVQRLLLEVGAGTQVDYLAAEAELAATRASASEARTATLLSRVELARLAGELSPDWFRRTLEAAP